ncbi:helix-turn-helix transcriptional regulator [Novosphingobium aquimarinum]|uniref:helix-turn-helix transcriptional regulator n=1 Tax=Novosphingobium aquimarinum TaxID=2682494 RepID=UPI0012EC6957|nr:helix-turn-helix transcriptional regulator [Novosphingobium aquimarinum]
MALTGPDETDLLLPLLTGSTEEHPFSTFLTRVQRRCDALYAALFIRAGAGEPLSYWVGPDLRQRARELGLAELNELDRVQYDLLRPGRVYASQEYYDADPVRRAQRMRHMARLGVTDERSVRILADPDLSAWLVIASKNSLRAADSALLSSLVPYVAAVLRNAATQDRSRIAEALSEAGNDRAGMGWIAFDRDGTILALPDRTRDNLLAVLNYAPQPGDRAGALSRLAEAEVLAAAHRFHETPNADPIAAVVAAAPRIEALLFPPGAPAEGIIPSPAVIALLRLPRAPSPTRAAGLAHIFGLPRREAELAIALYDGFSMAEAAERLGLTLETTRNYSKKLYSKLGVRGQSELVRLVAQSSAVLA